jgi:polyphosphate kinase 2 (PPK2 family)
VSNYRKKLIVKPGSEIRLKHFDPGYHGKHQSHKSALPEIEKNLQKMEDLQYRMYAENKHSLLIVLQGAGRRGQGRRSPPRLDWHESIGLRLC